MKKIISIIENKSETLLFIFILIIGVIHLNDFQGDPSIYFTYADNISQGKFLQFNRGEFSSGATSPLWAFILSIPFFLTSNLIFIKLFVLLITLFSTAYSFRLLKNKIDSFTLSLGFICILYFSLFPSLFAYETSLLLPFLSIIIISTNEKQYYSKKNLIALSILPLVRPDAIVFNITSIILLLIEKGKDGLKLKNLIKLIATLLPIIAYSLVSIIFTESFSSSSFSRSFALGEDARELMGIKYSFNSLIIVFSYPVIIWVLYIFYISFMKKNMKSEIKLSIFVILFYLIAFTVLRPISNHSSRYLIPIIISIVISSSFTATKNLTTLNFNVKKLLLMILIIPLMTMTGLKSAKYFNKYPKEIILNEKLAQKINSICKEGDTVLLYEVQTRLLINDEINVLSLDGITDGKVGPFLSDAKVYEFIFKYKPDYIVVNEAVNYRKYLSNSFLKKLYNMNLNVNDNFKYKNMSFETISINNSNYSSFADWKYLLKVSYN